jgi:ATP-dependent helicase/nuclease subunit B
MTDVPTDELQADCTYVASTRRLAHQLRARHDAACFARGLATWRTPDVVTWAELLRRQFEADRAAGRSTRRWVEPAQARLAWEAIVGRDPALAEVLAPAGVGAVAYRSWTLLHQYRIPYAALDSQDGLEARAFARWVAEYRAWLAAGDWLDQALASSTVGPFAAGSRLCLVGFERCTPDQVATIARLRGQGVQVDLRAPVVAGDTVRGHRVDCNDFDDEVETAARWLAQYLQREPGARVALIVPALDRERERVRRTLDRVFAPRSQVTGGPAPESTAYELAAARPLVERAVVGAALGWLEAAAGVAAPETLAALLLGPHDGAAAREADARVELDVELRREGVALRGLRSLLAAARRFGCVATAERLERVALRSRGWGRQRLPSQWALEFAAALRELGWPGAAPDSAEHQAVQRWQALLGEFGASDDVGGPMRVGAALALLRDLVQHTAFEPQEIAAPMLVIDPGTAVGMRFDASWICGLDATRWPAPASPDPFLPRDWQARQGVPGATAEVAEADARRTLCGLTHGATVAVCSVARFEDDAPLLPSALVADLPVLEALSLWQGAGTTQAQFGQRPRLEHLVDAALPAFAAQQVARGGTRLLELQAACPFRAAIELRLGGGALEDTPVGIAPTERGRLVHAVLQAFWSDVREQSALLAMPQDELEAAVHDYAQRALAPLREAADEVRRRLLDLEQDWLEARVRELLAQDAQREPFSVVHVEEPRVVDVGGVQIRVQLDRVDRLADGSYAVIDYKTSATAKPAAWMGERPQLPQLPLYVRAIGAPNVSAVAFGVVRKGDTGYAGYVGADGVFSGLEPFDPTHKRFRDYPDWQALMTEWQRRLEALAQEHASGDARLAPDPARACEYCHLPGLCRSAGAQLVAMEEGGHAAA